MEIIVQSIPNVCIYDHVTIGDGVTIHAGTVLGADAFYYKNRSEYYDQLKSSGTVVIENDVDLGALCTIDRGVTSATIIKEGTKIDNQVHVGHDTQIGKRCLIASQVGIAGCVIIEDQVTLWGQVGISSDIHIGKGATVLAQSGVGKNLEENKTYFGSPATEARIKFKELVSLKQLPRLISNIDS